jgi:hypothetical protein
MSVSVHSDASSSRRPAVLGLISISSRLATCRGHNLLAENRSWGRDQNSFYVGSL